MLLGGVVDPPEWASDLIHTLESCTGMPGGRKWVQDRGTDNAYAFGGFASLGAERDSSFQKKSPSHLPRTSEGFPPNSWGKQKNSGSYFESQADVSHAQHLQDHVTDWIQDVPSSSFDSSLKYNSPTRPPLNQSISHSSTDTTSLDMSYDNPARTTLHLRSHSAAGPSNTRYSDTSASAERFHPSFDWIQTTTTPRLKARSELNQPLEGVGRAIALFDFKAVEVTHLSSLLAPLIYSNTEWRFILH